MNNMMNERSLIRKKKVQKKRLKSVVRNAKAKSTGCYMKIMKHRNRSLKRKNDNLKTEIIKLRECNNDLAVQNEKLSIQQSILQSRFDGEQNTCIQLLFEQNLLKQKLKLSEETITKLHESINDMFTNTLLFTETLGRSKTIVNEYTHKVKGYKHISSTSFSEKSTKSAISKVNQVRPMVNGISIHNPVIALKRFNHRKLFKTFSVPATIHEREQSKRSSRLGKRNHDLSSLSGTNESSTNCSSRNYNNINTFQNSNVDSTSVSFEEGNDRINVLNNSATHSFVVIERLQLPLQIYKDNEVVSKSHPPARVGTDPMPKVKISDRSSNSPVTVCAIDKNCNKTVEKNNERNTHEVNTLTQASEKGTKKYTATELNRSHVEDPLEGCSWMYPASRTVNDVSADKSDSKSNCDSTVSDDNVLECKGNEENINNSKLRKTTLSPHEIQNCLGNTSPSTCYGGAETETTLVQCENKPKLLQLNPRCSKTIFRLKKEVVKENLPAKAGDVQKKSKDPQFKNKTNEAGSFKSIQQNMSSNRCDISEQNDGILSHNHTKKEIGCHFNSSSINNSEMPSVPSCKEQLRSFKQKCYKEPNLLVKLRRL